ncbi:MAG: hypothetical protein R2716_12245 [Microthrixaceae bacterium]
MPDATAELVVMVHDPDAPMVDGFTHWIATGISPEATGVGGSTATEFTSGINSAGEAEYMDPLHPPATVRTTTTSTSTHSTRLWTPRRCPTACVARGDGGPHHRTGTGHGHIRGDLTVPGAGAAVIGRAGQDETDQEDPTMSDLPPTTEQAGAEPPRIPTRRRARRPPTATCSRVKRVRTTRYADVPPDRPTLLDIDEPPGDAEGELDGPVLTRA